MTYLLSRSEALGFLDDAVRLYQKPHLDSLLHGQEFWRKRVEARRAEVVEHFGAWALYSRA